MAEAEAPEVTPPKEADLPQSSELDGSTPEEVPKVAAKKPRKPRPPKIVAKLATVAENSSPSAEHSEPQLPLEFWAGLMQTQKVIMAKRKSDHYNSFRIV